ncbi:MAG: hypothetical protein ACI85Q_001903 [Salibacteraceae bacterium]|jgi:hypothetical protein
MRRKTFIDALFKNKNNPASSTIITYQYLFTGSFSKSINKIDTLSHMKINDCKGWLTHATLID